MQEGDRGGEDVSVGEGRGEGEGLLLGEGGGGGDVTYMSGLVCCQAAEAGKAQAPPAIARGAANSMTRGWCHAASVLAWEGSVRQSMRASEPRTSATRRSLVVVACAQTELSACGNEIT